MILFLVATHYDGYLNIYLEKCKKEGLDYKILGLGDKWKGYAWKFNLVYEHLSTLDPNEIVIFTDAYDVIFLQNQKEVLTRFLEYNTPVLLSIENEPENLFHKYAYRKMFPKVLGKYSVNSGCYMGYAYALREMFFNLKNQYNLQDDDDDQQILAKFLNRNLDFVNNYCKFDEERKIFTNLLVKNYPDDKLPLLDTCFVHGPGNTNLRNIIKYYGLEGEEIAKKRNWMVYYRNALKTYTKYFKVEAAIILIILIILLIIIWRKKKLKKSTNK